MNLINGLMEYLNNNSGAIIAIATVGLVIITAYYARTTKKTLEQNQQMRADAQKPAIAAYPAEYNDPYGCVGLVFENTGAGPALDVKFDFDRDFKISSDRTLESVGFLQGADYIPVKYNRRHKLCVRSDNYFNTLIKEQLTIKVAYKDSMGNKYKHPLRINFKKSLQLKPDL